MIIVTIAPIEVFTNLANNYVNLLQHKEMFTQEKSE